MNIYNYTNFKGIWEDLGFDKSKNIFYNVNYGVDSSWDKLFELPAFDTAEKIFVVSHECDSHNYINKDNRIQTWDGTVSSHERIHTYLFWLDWVRQVEEHMSLCKKLLPANNKNSDILFDSLLGTMYDRPHKQFVLESIQSHGMNKFITGSCKSQCDTIPDGYVSGGEHENGSNVLNYNGLQTANTSCFVPYDIYNKTWYSLVCETRGTGDNLFFTEKIAKPLIAGRIFVLFGQYRMLEKLKTLGFKTFDIIIDESYDQEPNNELRYKKAWNQIEFLMLQDPLTMYQQCKLIIEHNKSVIRNINWYDILIKDMSMVANGVCYE